MTTPFTPTQYGAQLRFVLAAALGWHPHLFAGDEVALVAALRAAPDAAADLVARLLPRKRLPVREDALGAAPGAVDAAIAAGWLARRADPPPQASFLALAAPSAIAPTAAALALHRAALLVAWGDDVEDGSTLVRLAAEQLRAPPGTPLARALAGDLAPPPGLRAPFADRAALDGYLVARAARSDGPSPAAYAAALAAVAAAAGVALPLIGAQLTAIHHWTSLLWECVAVLPPGDPRIDPALRALRRAPAAPPLARRIWRAVHAREVRPLRARALARGFAGWALWPAGERARWRLRGEGARDVAARATWPTLRLGAWLERDGGSVLAQGEAVEEFALARLARDGWRGVRAEGGFWLALAAALFRAELAEAAPGAWVAPLQHAPLDWGRGGCGARRAAALARRAAEVVRDPVAALAASLIDGDWLPGLIAPPPLDAAQAVCAAFPRAALAELLTALLHAPREAAGLPDLVMWRDGRVALAEVKSPNDRLSDAQRVWLGWLSERGIDARVIRVDARAPRQQRAPWSPASAPAALPAPTRGRPPPRAPRREPPPLRLDLGPVAPGAPTGVAAAPAWAARPTLPAEAWNGRLGDGAVATWARPVEAVVALPARAVLACRERGRVVLERRWFTLPPGWAIPVLIAIEALPTGGVAARATLLERPAGWLLPRSHAEREPVVAPLAELAAVADGAVADWSRHPDSAPWRPELAAGEWGVAGELADQLALIGSTPYRLRVDDRALWLDLPADAACLWVAGDVRLRRGVLDLAAERMPPAAGTDGVWRNPALGVGLSAR